MRLRRLALYAALVALACHNTAETKARNDLAAALRDSIGAKGNPSVSFLMYGDARNLQLQFDTVAFADMADSSFDVRARSIAEFAVRHYSDAPGDSVIVLARNPEQPGVWKIVRRRAFATPDLVRTR